MKKSGVILLVNFLFLLGLSASQPAQAKTIPGAKCVKSKAIVKIGGATYRCARNPYWKPSSRTWTSVSCLESYQFLVSSKKRYEDWKDIVKLLGTEGENEISKLSASITSLEETLKTQICKI